MDNLEANRKAVLEFFGHISSSEIDAAFALVSASVQWWVPGTLPFSGTKTKSEYLQVVQAIQTGFPDGLSLEVKSMIAEGDMVAAEVESMGTHTNGRVYNNRYHFLIRIEAGQFVEVKEYMDTLHLFDLLKP